MPTPPKDPEGFDKINYVIDSWTTACDAPWYIYIETLRPALLEAFIVLISFGWADVIRGRFRPKGLGRRTSKRKGKWTRRRPRFPELGNTLGKALPFGEQVEDFVKWGTKTRFLWRIDNAMQAGLFMWLVVDVAEDFAFNWTSLLYKTYWCREAHLGRFSYHNGGMYGVSSWSWHKHPYGVKDYEYSPPTWLYSFGIVGSRPVTVIASARFQKWGGFPAPTNCIIRVWNPTTGQIWVQSEGENVGPSGTLDVPLICTVPAGEEFEVRNYHEGTWCLVGDGVIVATERDVQ